MKFLVNLICLASMASVASAQTTRVGSAQNLLQLVAKTYREAEVLTDSIQIEIKTPNGTQSMAMEIVLNGKDEGQLSWGNYTYTGKNDSFYIVKDSIPNKYIRKSLDDGFIQTLYRETQGGFPVPHFALREAETKAQYVSSFGLGSFPNLELQGVESATHNGKSMQALKFKVQQVSMVAYVDPATKLVEFIEVLNGPVTVTINMQPKIHEALPQAIAFKSENAREVDTIRLEAGDPAPDFELVQLDGTMVKLSDLKGSMVVLDFWATWCGPCIRGLPELNKFAQWAENSGHPVKVYAIDAFERVRTDEQKRQKIERFWNAKQFSFPTLIDYTRDSPTAYEVGPIPHSVVINPDGTIHKVHIGYNPQMFTVLKQEAAQIFEN